MYTAQQIKALPIDFQVKEVYALIGDNVVTIFEPIRKDPTNA